MLNITTILGSPRKAGNTASILKLFEQAATGKNKVFRINISDYNIKGCIGCDACQKYHEGPGCKQNDDFGKIITQMLNSELIIYSTPVYVWDFPAQMKALVDRHYCLVKYMNIEKTKYLFENKNTALLATSGGDIKSNADLLQEIYKREMNYLHCKISGIYLLSESSLTSDNDEKDIIIKRMINELL